MSDLTFSASPPSCLDVSIRAPTSSASRGRRSSAPAPAPPLAPFDVLVESHGAALLRFCSSRLGPDRGEEAFQETLLAALRHYDELRDPGAAGGWLFAIARSKIADAVRSPATRSESRGTLDEHEGTWNDPEPGAAEEIWARVAALPPRQREALTLRFMADLSHAGIAEATGTSAEAARRNVFEGLRRLRREIADG